MRRRRRWGFVIAVVSAAAFAGCDLGLAPFVEPTDEAGSVPSPTAEGGSDAVVPGSDARPPDDAAIPVEAGDAGDAGGVKRVFVTSAVTNGAFGGLAGADTRCQQAATAAALGGTFVAWVSVTGTAATARINDVGPWYLVDGKTLVFANKAAITATGPAVPIDRDEKGAVAGAQELVWTGTASNGTAAGQNCTNFTAQLVQQGQAGTTKEKNAQWTQNGNVGCQQQLHLYCFEQ